MASECHFLLFFMYTVMGICAPASHLRLKSLKHSLPNVYFKLLGFNGYFD